MISSQRCKANVRSTDTTPQVYTETIEAARKIRHKAIDTARKACCAEIRLRIRMPDLEREIRARAVKDLKPREMALHQVQHPYKGRRTVKSAQRALAETRDAVNAAESSMKKHENTIASLERELEIQAGDRWPGAEPSSMSDLVKE